MPTDKNSESTKRRWLTLVALLTLSAVMYTSIMYKIVNYGP